LRARRKTVPTIPLGHSGMPRAIDRVVKGILASRSPRRVKRKQSLRLVRCFVAVGFDGQTVVSHWWKRVI
jgi:hypothetical protein